MRAISLWQPWASAMAALLKNNETRSWETKFRGMVAIHAAKRWTKDEQGFYLRHKDRVLLPTKIPFGAIVAVGRLVDCVPTESVSDAVSEREYSWGNYEIGRFAWKFEDLRALATPIPFRGAQGFFSVPDELLNAGAMTSQAAR